MFSGIVEATGIVRKIEKIGSSLDITIQSDFSAETYIDQSIAHNGVCLTVTRQDDQTFSVTAIEETLNKTNLGSWKEGDLVNLERSLFANSRIDGHFVQGHVEKSSKLMEVGISIFQFLPNGKSIWSKKDRFVSMELASLL